MARVQWLCDTILTPSPFDSAGTTSAPIEPLRRRLPHANSATLRNTPQAPADRCGRETCLRCVDESPCTANCPDPDHSIEIPAERWLPVSVPVVSAHRWPQDSTALVDLRFWFPWPTSDSEPTPLPIVRLRSALRQFVPSPAGRPGRPAPAVPTPPTQRQLSGLADEYAPVLCKSPTSRSSRDELQSPAPETRPLHQTSAPGPALWQDTNEPQDLWDVILRPA